MWKVSGNFEDRWRENREGGGSNAKFFDCEFNVNPAFASAQLLAAIKMYVSSTLDNVGQECVLETYSTASSSWW